MSQRLVFIQECPTCGRRLRIRVEYLGRKLACSHCRGKLIARDPAGPEGAVSGSEIMVRAEQLLEESSRFETARISNPR
jgi:DNA-directed RNA polymerase subunit RPC12/RpoP